MRYFSALCARMYRLSANSRATISSTAIFLSQQSRQYRSSPRGSDTSFAPQSAHRAWTTVLRDMAAIVLREMLNAEFCMLNLARSKDAPYFYMQRSPVIQHSEISIQQFQTSYFIAAAGAAQRARTFP